METSHARSGPGSRHTNRRANTSTFSRRRASSRSRHGVVRFSLCTVLCLVVGATLPALVRAAPTDLVVGEYLAEDRDHKIELFFDKHQRLFGKIVWTKDPKLTDRKNKDPKLRNRRLVGIVHIRGLSRDNDGVWRGGTLYNPQDGGVYNARLWREGKHELTIQGRPAVPVIGRLLGAIFGRISYTRVAAQ